MTALLIRSSSAAGRLLAGAIAVVGLATARLDTAALAASAAVVLLAVGTARPRPGTLALRALPAIGVIAAVLAPLLLSGESARAGLLGMRALFAVSVALSIASTVPLAEVPGALGALGVPDALCAVTGTMLRQLGAVRDEGRRLVLARKLRGARGPALGAGTLATLLLRTADRAGRVELAMRLRGYTAAEASAHSGLRARDALVVLASVTCAVAVHVV